MSQSVTSIVVSSGLWSGVRLGLRQLWRDVRAGELRLLMLSVMLAVAALSAVGILADRIQGALWRDARQMLGGDLVIVSDQAPPERLTALARSMGLQHSLNLSFPTMARSQAPGGESRLVALKAVQSDYPLRGTLRLRQSPEGPVQVARGAPARHEVWVDAPLLEALDLQLGDRLSLGEQVFRISALIEQEPDRGSGFLNFAPRVMLAESDLAATELVQPASRITWRLALAGPDDRIRDYRLAVEAQLRESPVRGLRIESIDTGRPEMRQTLDRAGQFLNLVALLAALLCAVAVALAARSYAERQLDVCALLRVLGQSQRTLVSAYATEFLLAGLLAALAGCAAGWGAHWVLVQWLAGLVDSRLPAPSPWPVLSAIGVGLTLLVAFGLPPVLQLAQVPALRVMRRELGAPRRSAIWILLAALAGFGLTLLAVSRDLLLGGLTVLGFALALCGFAALAWLGLQALRRSVPGLRSRLAHQPWAQALTLATRQVTARPALAVTQVSALSVGLLALSLLVLLRTDLVNSWRQATPADAPDRFVINVQPDQAPAFLDFLRDNQVRERDWFPMIRGRLIAINEREVQPSDFTGDRAQRLVEREFNLSFSRERPSHNPVVAGRWTEEEKGGVSVEEGIAETLGLRLGDRLRFDVGGVVHESTITSVRHVDWGSLRANFFMLFPVSQMPELPTTYMAAFRTPTGVPRFESRMLQQFPNVTSVDMGSTLAQVQRVLDQVIRAVEFLFAMSLLAGLLVLLAALGTSRQVREREYALMRAMGAQQALLARVQRLELLGVGFLAGFMASGVAWLLGWVLARQVFGFGWNPPLWTPLAGGAAGALLAWLAGSLSLRGVLRQSVIQTLRQGGE